MARGLARRYVKERGRPDLIHAHCGIRAGYAARQIALDIGCPYVVCEHFTGFARQVLRPWEEGQARAAYAGAAALSAVSGALARTIQPYTRGRPITVIPNSIRLENFPLVDRLPSKRFTFLTVSNLDAKKRVELLIETFANEFKGADEVHLRIGGDGPTRNSLQALARNLGLERQVCFLGRLTRQEVCEAMQAAECFVLPSQFETFGVVIIEAMATGLPVVATASGGPEEIITDATGIVVPVECGRELAKGMKSVYMDRDKWRQAGPEIRAHVCGRYSMEVVGRKLLAFYERALASSNEVGQGVR
jgi:glycosyltransferase involved in cell wall biosynthesis